MSRWLAVSFPDLITSIYQLFLIPVIMNADNDLSQGRLAIIPWCRTWRLQIFLSYKMWLHATMSVYHLFGTITIRRFVVKGSQSTTFKFHTIVALDVLAAGQRKYTEWKLRMCSEIKESASQSCFAL